MTAGFDYRTQREVILPRSVWQKMVTRDMAEGALRHVVESETFISIKHKDGRYHMAYEIYANVAPKVQS